MPEQIYTFSDEEIARMFKSGEMKVLTTPAETVQKTAHEKALEKAKKLFGKDFEDVFTLQIGGRSKEQLIELLEQARIDMGGNAKFTLMNECFTTLPLIKNIELIKIGINDLGFEKHASTEQIYQKAKDLGLALCEAEVGPHLILNYNQAEDHKT